MQLVKVNHQFLLRVSFIAGLGGLLYGFDMGIIAAALLYVHQSFQLSIGMEEAIVSVVLVGAMVGAVSGGAIADRIGRRGTLLWGAVAFIVGSLLASFAPNAGTLIAARALLGIAIGFTSVTAPVYVSELAPPQSRGRLIGLYQFALTLGIAGADLTGYMLSGTGAWRTMFGVGIAPALLFLICVVALPESPRWLCARGNMGEAARVLRTYTDETGVALLMQDIETGLARNTETRWSALWSPGVRGFLCVAVGFTVLQQVTGINTIIYYGPRIFSLAGVRSDKSAILATFIVAVVNVLATLIALALVDRVGRRPLLYAGLSGMTVALAALSWSFRSAATHSTAATHSGAIALGCLVLYIVCFAFSMGPIAWILVAELFPLRLRGRGVAAASAGSGIANFAVASTFLSLIHAVGSSITFLIYATFCVVTFLFVRRFVPETARRDLETISAG